MVEPLAELVEALSPAMAEIDSRQEAYIKVVDSPLPPCKPKETAALDRFGDYGKYKMLI